MKLRLGRWRSGSALGAAPQLIARPIHRLGQGLAPDLIGDDGGDLVERRREALRMALAAMGAQQLHTGAAVEDPERRHARIVLPVPHSRLAERRKSARSATAFISAPSIRWRECWSLDSRPRWLTKA